MHEALESGVLRLAYGLLRFVMIGFGIAAAMKVYALFGPPPTTVHPAALARVIVASLVVDRQRRVTVCLQGRRRDTPWIIAGVLVAFGAHEVTKTIFPPDGSPFLATLLLGAVAIIQYRLGGRLPAILIIPGFLQIALWVPGERGRARAATASARNPRAVDTRSFTSSCWSPAARGRASPSCGGRVRPPATAREGDCNIE